MGTKSALIAQGGGPTSVINSSLSAAIRELQKYRKNTIDRIFIALFGAEGILHENLLDVSGLSSGQLDDLELTVCAAAGSSRTKPNSEPRRQRVLQVLEAHNIRLLFLIGGGDTASTVGEINTSAERLGYDIICFHILKTVDNDGYGLFSPGWGSAARAVRDATVSLIKEVDAMPGIQLLLSMGRDSGWITAASSAAFLAEGRNKRRLQRIYTPETGFTLDRFTEECTETFERYGKLVVNVSEGLQEDGADISFTEHLLRKYMVDREEALHADDHGQISFGDVRSVNTTDWLADYLGNVLRQRTGRRIRVRGNSLYYTARCPLLVPPLDLEAGRLVGKQAVDDSMMYLGAEGQTGTYGGSVVIKGSPKRDVITSPLKAVTVELEKMCNKKTGKGIQYKMPDELMTTDGPRKRFFEYSNEIINGDVIVIDPKRFITFTDVKKDDLVEKKLPPYGE